MQIYHHRQLFPHLFNELYIFVLELTDQLLTAMLPFRKGNQNDCHLVIDPV